MNEKILEFDLLGFGIVLLLGGWLSFDGLFGTKLFYFISIPLMIVGLLFICLSLNVEKISKWLER
jgi:hypothetical protein